MTHSLSHTLTHTHTLPSIGEHGYYDDDTNDNAAPEAEWENRKVVGLVWEKFRGWRLETKVCDDMTGESTNYLVNKSMIRMIKESTRNRRIRFRSAM